MIAVFLHNNNSNKFSKWSSFVNFFYFFSIAPRRSLKISYHPQKKNRKCFMLRKFQEFRVHARNHASCHVAFNMQATNFFISALFFCCHSILSVSLFLHSTKKQLKKSKCHIININIYRNNYAGCCLLCRERAFSKSNKGICTNKSDILN